jgi:hypothetical protein
MKQAIPPGKDASGRLEQMLSRRVSDEPLQYILGNYHSSWLLSLL